MLTTLPPPPHAESLKKAASERYDHAVYLGDMNYRINGNRSAVDTLIASRMHEVWSVQGLFGLGLMIALVTTLCGCVALSRATGAVV